MASLSVGVACVLLVLCMVVPSLAAVYTVGDTSGWTTGIDYSTWTQGKTFKVGDTLVDEVSSSDYSTCTVGNAIRSDNSGSTTVTLKAAGTHYFICGVVGHCGNGMKLAVKVESSSSTTATTTTTNPDFSYSSSNRSSFAAYFITCVALIVILVINVSLWQEF
ncbi:hypothetical protein Godav_009548 [Gossypium davidsonii]|uniref:Phytocyanin domain-containing protein n=3 Tax=Gossypium TaxID=3633 RepID=A0A7J8SDI4_GOSDV|nr:hypothetical protein [Gossypium davidsonii]MBA0659729.1 hypothetical protein [Gossypium klotzschianum]